MHEDDLRALIRDAIARHVHTEGRDGQGRDGSLSRPSPMPSRPIASARSGNAPYLQSPGSTPYLTHLSHGRFVFLAPTDPDAPCVVEPEVRCHHCGFCQSYGH